MVGALVAGLLAAADGGFEPVVYSVHHGEVYLDDPASLDGGYLPQPVMVPSGTFMDEPTTRWVAANKARSRGEATTWRAADEWSMPGVRWMLGALGLGILTGALGFGLLWWQFLR